MALWCRDCATVRPAAAVRPTPITIVVPYYEHPIFFRAQLGRWADWRETTRALLHVIVVDDGSPSHPAIDIVRAMGWPAWLRVFRIEIDIRWNWLAARNIGAHHAADRWLLLTDMDHVVPEETFRSVCHAALDPAVVYAFARREHTGEMVPPHSASFLLTRDLFWRIGGYDERLSGYYGTDGTFRREIGRFATIQLLTDALERHEYIDDASVVRYGRKQPEDARVRDLVAARRMGWRPKVLSFPYHEELAE